jgi:MFS family permease
VLCERDPGIKEITQKSAGVARWLLPWYGVETLVSYVTTLLNAGVYWYAAEILTAGDSARLWLSAIYGYGYIATAMFGGRLVERWGPRRVGIGALGGCAIFALLGLACTRFLGLIGLGMAMMLFNLGSTPFWPAAETAITHAPGTWRLSTRTGLYNILWSATSFLAFFTVGKIFQQGCLLSYLVAAGLSIISLAILIAFTRPAASSHAAQANGVGQHADQPEDPRIARRATRLLHTAWISNALAYVAIQTLVPIIPTLTRSAHLSTPAAGAAASSMWAFTRTVRFRSGRYERPWVKNVVAIGNAFGFVEPLEATALGMICHFAQTVAMLLHDGDCAPRATQRNLANELLARAFDNIRWFLSIHYKFNDRLDTPFWRDCRSQVDFSGAAHAVEFFQENGPTPLLTSPVLDPNDPFGAEGYLSILVGLRVPYQQTYSPSEQDKKTWSANRTAFRHLADQAVGIEEAFQRLTSPEWKWDRAAFVHPTSAGR